MQHKEATNWITSHNKWMQHAASKNNAIWFKYKVLNTLCRKPGIWVRKSTVFEASAICQHCRHLNLHFPITLHFLLQHNQVLREMQLQRKHQNQPFKNLNFAPCLITSQVTGLPFLWLQKFIYSVFGQNLLTPHVHQMILQFTPEKCVLDTIQ